MAQKRNSQLEELLSTVFVRRGEPVRLTETDGPTTLDIGDIEDGELLRRAGSSVVGQDRSVLPGDLDFAGFARLLTWRSKEAAPSTWVDILDIGVPVAHDGGRGGISGFAMIGVGTTAAEGYSRKTRTMQFAGRMGGGSDNSAVSTISSTDAGSHNSGFSNMGYPSMRVLRDRPYGIYTVQLQADRTGGSTGNPRFDVVLFVNSDVIFSVTKY